MMSRRVLARSAALLFVSVSLVGCAGFKTPHPFGLGAEKAPKERASEGERIPVLGGTDVLAVAPALKGVSFSIPPAQPIGSWPIAGGTIEQSVENVDAGKGFKIAWRKQVGMGSTRRTHVMDGPISAEGHLFLLDGQGSVFALDENGKELWHDNFRPRKGRDMESFGGGLAYADGVIYLASGYRFLAAIDAKTGDVKWRSEVASPIHSAPNVAGGRVYATDVTDQMYAFDAATGASDWSYQALEEPARMLVASSPAISGPVVVSGFASGELVAFNTANGNVLWQNVLSLTNRNNALSEIRDIAGRPVIYRGAVYAGSHSGVFNAVDMRTGTPAWSLPISTITSPWAAGDVVYVTDQSGQLICIARDSGQIYWIRQLNTDIPGNPKRKQKKKIKAVWSSPFIASGRLILVNDNGDAVALDAQTGDLQSTLKLGSPAFSSPIAVNGTVYVLTLAGELIAIR
ncbi:MAG: PQQ-like beta-propeller repeat protein [Caulobacteraceae bacterium]